MTESASPVAEQGAAIVGQIHGGQQPVVGAHVYLLQANTTGYGAASISLLNASSTGQSDSVGAYVLTTSTGAFSISTDYTCSVGSQVYVYALGGNPGAGTNANAGFLAALGQCPSAGNFAATVPYVWVNEVSTVAAAYALAGYATDALHVSSSGTTLALTGIANAFATAASMVNVATGIAYTGTPAGSAAVPQTTINTLANILASCVNTTGGCGTLFAIAKSNGSTGTTATDTATVAINIAHYPGNNTAILYSLLPATPAFAPQLASAPNDFTVSLTYTGGGISKPEGIAVDAAGSVWVANYGSTGVTKILASGAFASGSPFTGAGLGPAEAVAIDASGNAWIANTKNNTLSEFTSTGTAVSTAAGYSGGGLSAPDAIAIDSKGYVWVGNSTRGVCLSEFSASGTAISGPTGYANGTGPGEGGCSALESVAIDAAGDVWAVNNDGSAVVEYYGSSAASNLLGTEIRGIGNGGLTSPTSVAINEYADVWVANGGKNAADASAYSDSTGQSLAGPSGYTGGGLNVPYGVAADGASNLWFANSGGSVSELNSSGTALSPSSTGYVSTSFSTPYAIAIDGSGNVWIADEAANAVVEMVGLATPVVTPIVAGLKTPYAPGVEP
jgi:streptogramin lyase